MFEPFPRSMAKLNSVYIVTPVIPHYRVIDVYQFDHVLSTIFVKIISNFAYV